MTSQEDQVINTDEIKKHTMNIHSQLESSWNKLIDQLSDWLDAIVLGLPNFVFAILIFIISLWLSRTVEVWSERALKQFMRQTSLRQLMAKGLAIAVIGLGLLLALGILNLDKVLKSLLAGAGVAGLAVGLALQGTLSNTFSGIFLSIKDIVSIGDWIETNGYVGKVIEIDLLNTKINETDNNVVVIPNKMVLENPMKNYGLTPRVRVTVTCGVAYDSDLKRVKELVLKVVKDIFDVEVGEKVEFHYLAFGGSSIDFHVRFWINATANGEILQAKSDAIMAIKAAFDKEGIEIPFPIRTVYMKNEE
ncbi:mechanosensitive ion channel family protein [Algivirga pacifica]|uniref:Mechanosensitive ion channel protein MscS n=1 Tax=Algivirga pacifica TaxID=1162670 RepID=A0ABP9DHI5_9BACT